MYKTVTPYAPRPNPEESASYQEQHRCPDGYRIGYCGIYLSSLNYRGYSTSTPVRAIYARRPQDGPERRALVDIESVSDLWLRFSRLRTDNDIAVFARRFGLLDTRHSPLVLPLRKNGKWSDDRETTMVIARRLWAKKMGLSKLSDEQLELRSRSNMLLDILVTGEPIALWEAYLSEIQPLVRVYNAIKNLDLKYLKGKFRWEAESPSGGYYALRYLVEPDEFLVTKDLVTRGSHNDDWIDSSDLLKHDFSVNLTDYIENMIDPAASKDIKIKGDFITPARMFLCKRVNSFLSSHINIALVSSLDLSELRLRIVPENLITAIWYQFARAIAAGQEIAACRNCGEFFAKLNRRGSDQKYCSSACRTMNYRLRRERKIT